MAIKVYLSTVDRVVDPEDAKVSVFDRGFLYGDSVYETMRTVGGRAFELGRHLLRLRRSAGAIGFDVPFSDEHLTAAITATMAESGNPESTIRVVVTRGQGRPLMLDPRTASDPLLVIMVMPLQLPSEEQYRAGLSVAVIGAQKSGHGLLDPAVKSGNYLGNVLALGQAIERGADDAILCGPDGAIAEGATSNVFVVRDERLVTPHLRTGLLAGITRELVCELAVASGLDVVERRIDPSELREADEIFLTSSVRGLMPVTRVDGHVVGDGAMGPVTRRLSDGYRRHIESWARRGRDG